MKQKDIFRVLSYLSKTYRLHVSNLNDGRFFMRVYERGSNNLLVERNDSNFENLVIWLQTICFGEKLFHTVVNL